MKNPITAYCEWHDDQMWKAGNEPTYGRAMLHGLGIGTVDGLISIGVMALICVGVNGVELIVKKIKK